MSVVGMTGQGIAGPVGDWPGRHRAGRVGRRRRGWADRGSEVAASYNDWMSTLLRSGPDHAHLPVGLSVEEAVRIAEAVTAAHAESTRTMYDWAWSQWERWCTARGAAALPAEPALVYAYLTERAAAGLSVGSIDLACGAVAYQHRRRGLDDPILTEGVRQVRRGLRRIIGTAPRRRARPLGTGEIRQIVEHIDRSTALGSRDAAPILLGFGSPPSSSATSAQHRHSSTRPAATSGCETDRGVAPAAFGRPRVIASGKGAGCVAGRATWQVPRSEGSRSVLFQASVVSQGHLGGLTPPGRRPPQG